MAEHDDWDTVHQKKDPIRLLEMLQNVNFTYGSNQEPVLSMWVAKNDFIKLQQGKHQSVQEYYKRFMALKEVNESLGNSILQDPGILEIVAKEHGQNTSNLSGNQKEAFIKEGQERMLAMKMLMGADQK